MTSSKGQRQVEFLKQVTAAGGTIVKASFSIERGLGRTNPTYLLTLDQHGALTLQDLPWTPELEEYLLHECPTQMDSRADERERFANLLSNNLKTIEAQFGPDFAQAVFVEVLGEHPEYGLASFLGKVPVYPPICGGDNYHACRMLIEHAIAGLQNTAVLTLYHPDNKEIIQLVGEALGIASRVWPSSTKGEGTGTGGGIHPGGGSGCGIPGRGSIKSEVLS
jgi:hypothetical protein